MPPSKDRAPLPSTARPRLGTPRNRWRVAFLASFTGCLLVGCGGPRTGEATDATASPPAVVSAPSEPPNRWVNRAVRDQQAPRLVAALSQSLLHGFNLEAAFDQLDSQLDSNKHTLLLLRQCLENPNLARELEREWRKLDLARAFRENSRPVPANLPSAADVSAGFVRWLEEVRPLIVDFCEAMEVRLARWEPGNSPYRDWDSVPDPVNLERMDWERFRGFVDRYDDELARLDPRWLLPQNVPQPGDRVERRSQTLLQLRRHALREARGGISNGEVSFGNLLDLPVPAQQRWLPAVAIHLETAPMRTAPTAPPPGRPTARLPVEVDSEGRFARVIHLGRGVEAQAVWGEVAVESVAGEPQVRLVGRAPAVVLVGQRTTPNLPPAGRLLWLVGIDEPAQDRVLAHAPVAITVDTRQGPPYRFWAETHEARYADAPSIAVLSRNPITVDYTRFSGGERIPPRSLTGNWQAPETGWKLEFATTEGDDDPRRPLRFVSVTSREETSLLAHHPRAGDLRHEASHWAGGTSVILCEPLDANGDGVIDVVMWGSFAYLRASAP
jgi:hypothetical protein